MATLDQDKLSKRYKRIFAQLQELLTKTENKTARMATVVSLLHHKMPHYFWTGFYVLSDKDLIIKIIDLSPSIRHCCCSSTAAMAQASQLLFEAKLQILSTRSVE